MANDFHEILGDYLSIPITFYDLEIPRLNTKSKRRTDIVFQRNITKEIYTTYVLQDAYAIGDIKPIAIETPFCKYFMDVFQDGNQLIVNRTFKLFEGVYSKSDYVNIAKTFKAIRKHERSKINIKQRPE